MSVQIVMVDVKCSVSIMWGHSHVAVEPAFCSAVMGHAQVSLHDIV